jgi:hypothetical protein
MDRSDLDAVERGLAVVRQAMRREKEASRPDKYDRIPSEMPTALRALYETGTWSSSPVYCWDLVASVSTEGHEKAKAAEDALSHMSFRPPPGLAEVAHTTLRAEHSPAVMAAASFAEPVRDAVRQALEAQKEARAAKARTLTGNYRDLRKWWLAGLAAAEEKRAPQEKENARIADRVLVMATRASSGMGNPMSAKECDGILKDILAAGGTAGGVTRWGLSLATIPVQMLTYRPPDGGVLVDDPLAEHYAAKNVNPWTRAERLLFLEKFLSHGKNFRRIATFFEHKSVEDVVRFYFENKKPLKLKQLAKDGFMKKRASKKNALIELSRMPTEARSIKNNFAGEAACATMAAAMSMHEKDDVLINSCTASNGGGRSNSSEASLMREAGKGWKLCDQQALVFALCRHKIDDDFSSLGIPVVWCRISYEVRTKSPAQCRQFYVHFKALLGLDKFQPPDLSSVRKNPPKRPRPLELAGPKDEPAEPPLSRPRQSVQSCERELERDQAGAPSVQRASGGPRLPIASARPKPRHTPEDEGMLPVLPTHSVASGKTNGVQNAGAPTGDLLDYSNAPLQNRSVGNVGNLVRGGRAVSDECPQDHGISSIPECMPGPPTIGTNASKAYTSPEENGRSGPKAADSGTVNLPALPQAGIENATTRHREPVQQFPNRRDSSLNGSNQMYDDDSFTTSAGAGKEEPKLFKEEDAGTQSLVVSNLSQPVAVLERRPGNFEKTDRSSAAGNQVPKLEPPAPMGTAPNAPQHGDLHSPAQIAASRQSSGPSGAGSVLVVSGSAAGSARAPATS